MVEQGDAAIRGTCIDCGKIFKLPNARKVFTCKACGGEVHPNVDPVDEWEEEEEEEEEEERQYSPNEERRLHRRDLQVYRKLQQLRTGILATGPLAALGACAYWYMMPSMRDAKLYELSTDTSYLMLTGALQAAAALASLVASLMILRMPLAMIWMAAIIQTAAAGAAWWGFTLGGYQLWALLFSLLAVTQLGLATLVNADAREALAENPDFFEDQEEEARSHARERHEDRPVPHWVPPAKAWGLTTIVLAGSWFGVQGLTAKPTYAANSATFVDAFQRGDLPSINRFFQSTPKLIGQFETYAKNKGWIEGGWPSIEEASAFERTDSAYVTYRSKDGELLALWKRVGDDWQLGGFGAKNETYDAIEKALRERNENWREEFSKLADANAAFVQALATGDLEGVQKLQGGFATFDPVGEMAAKHEWETKGWPKLVAIDTQEEPISVWGETVFDGIRVSVTYAGTEPRLQASWFASPNGWLLSSLREEPQKAN